MGKEKATLDASVAEGFNDPAFCSMRVTFLDFVQFRGDVVLDVLGLGGDLVAKLLGFGFACCPSVGALRIGYVLGGVFGLSPGLAGCAFDLLGCSGVGDLLVADAFAE